MNTILKIGMLIGFLLAVYCAKAQTSDYDNDLVMLLRVNGSTETDNMMYDQLKTLQQMMKPGVLDSVWSNLKREV